MGLWQVTGSSLRVSTHSLAVSPTTAPSRARNILRHVCTGWLLQGLGEASLPACPRLDQRCDLKSQWRVLRP